MSEFADNNVNCECGHAAWLHLNGGTVESPGPCSECKCKLLTVKAA